jgi:hypothetical protein
MTAYIEIYEWEGKDAYGEISVYYTGEAGPPHIDVEFGEGYLYGITSEDARGIAERLNKAADAADRKSA